jgi:hypothetical protein
MTASTQDIEAIVGRLTYNGAVNLRGFVEDNDPVNPDMPKGRGHFYTGSGKYTTLAAIGVENHLVKHGLAVRTGAYGHLEITPLGRQVAAHVAGHWNVLYGTFRNAR